MTPELRTEVLELDFACQCYVQRLRAETSLHTFKNLDLEHVIAADWATRLSHVLGSLLKEDAIRRGRPELLLTPHETAEVQAQRVAQVRAQIIAAHRVAAGAQTAADLHTRERVPPSEPVPDDLHERPDTPTRPRAQP